RSGANSSQLSFPTRRSSELIGEDNTDVHYVGVVLKVPVFSGLSGIHRWRAAEKRREGAERHLRAVERDSRVQVSNAAARWAAARSEEHTSELQSRENLVCRL